MVNIDDDDGQWVSRATKLIKFVQTLIIFHHHSQKVCCAYLGQDWETFVRLDLNSSLDQTAGWLTDWDEDDCPNKYSNFGRRGEVQDQEREIEILIE